MDQPQEATARELEADIVICGGGTAGCVLAGRLADRFPELEIVVIEDGVDSYGVAEIDQPLTGVMGVMTGSSNYTYHTAQTSDAAGGRQVTVPTGHVLGGGSSVNWLTYQNAAASDFDDWNQPGWSFEDLLPCIRKSIKYQCDGDLSVHDSNGAVPVSYGGHKVQLEADLQISFANVMPGLSQLDDMADFKHGAGWGRCQKFISTEGKRSTAAVCLRTASGQLKPGIHLKTEKTVYKVLFEGDRAVGVNITSAKSSSARGEETVRARKQVILCAGALGTPAILERSGIGSSDLLGKAGIECRVDLPGVGEGYQDHPLILWSYFVSDINGLDAFMRGDPKVVEEAMKQWQKDGSGIIATSPPDWIAKLRPASGEQAVVGAELGAHWKEIGGATSDKPMMTLAFPSFFPGDYSSLPPDSHCLSTGIWFNYPGSRGHVHITSPHPHDPLSLETGMLSHPADVQAHIWGYKVSREVMRHLGCYRGEVAVSHPAFSPDSRAATAFHTGPQTQPLKYTPEDDKAIEAMIRRTANTCWHSMSTCQMRSREDGGVVSASLDVYGVKGLKIADLSICPSNCGCNTASVALIIGEKAAEILINQLADT